MMILHRTQLFFERGNNILIKLYQCGPSTADHAVATFEISNIEDEVSTFRGKGVNFEGKEIFFVFTRQQNRRICEDGLEKTT
jgi:hypothetical protein